MSQENEYDDMRSEMATLSAGVSRTLTLVLSRIIALDVKVETLIRLLDKPHPSRTEIDEILAAVWKEELEQLRTARSLQEDAWIKKFLENYEGNVH